MKFLALSFFLVFFSVPNNYSEPASEIINVSEDQVLKAFKQMPVKFRTPIKRLGGGGNCASIAVIKAAIGTFGINGVFTDVKVDSDQKMVYITRRDGKVIDLHFDRLNYAKDWFFVKSEGDEISEQITEYARFCFAVMARARHLQMKNPNKGFYKAVDDLNKGESTNSIYRLLGLEMNAIEDLSLENLNNFKHIVLYNAPHAVYGSSGKYDEAWEDGENIQRVEPLERLQTIHCKSGNTCPIIGAYTLR